MKLAIQNRKEVWCDVEWLEVCIEDKNRDYFTNLYRFPWPKMGLPLLFTTEIGGFWSCFEVPLKFDQIFWAPDLPVPKRSCSRCQASEGSWREVTIGYWEEGRLGFKAARNDETAVLPAEKTTRKLYQKLYHHIFSIKHVKTRKVFRNCQLICHESCFNFLVHGYRIPRWYKSASGSGAGSTTQVALGLGPTSIFSKCWWEKSGHQLI